MVGAYLSCVGLGRPLALRPDRRGGLSGPSRLRRCRAGDPGVGECVLAPPEAHQSGPRGRRTARVRRMASLGPPVRYARAPRHRVAVCRGVGMRVPTTVPGAVAPQSSTTAENESPCPHCGAFDTLCVRRDSCRLCAAHVSPRGQRHRRASLWATDRRWMGGSARCVEVLSVNVHRYCAHEDAVRQGDALPQAPIKSREGRTRSRLSSQYHAAQRRALSRGRSRASSCAAVFGQYEGMPAQSTAPIARRTTRSARLLPVSTR